MVRSRQILLNILMVVVAAAITYYANTYKEEMVVQPAAHAVTKQVPKQEKHIPIVRKKITRYQVFADKLLPYAIPAAAKMGIDPNALIAQVILETGNGKHVYRNNLFGIKSKRGKKVVTSEFINGKFVKVRSSFRTYPSYKESFDDYVKFIMNSKRYAKAMKHVHTPERYFRELKKSGYATDPRYADKIISIYRRL